MLDTDRIDTTMADAFAQAGFDTTTVIETDDDGDDGPRAQSQTAIACEQAQLFGATPERDEFDPRDIWDRDDATDAVGEAFRIIAEGVTPDGFQLADERESLLWGFVNCLDAQVRRLDRATRPAAPGDARPRTRAGRHRGEGPRARAHHRPGAELRRPPRRLRDHARPRRRRLPRRDRRRLAPATRLARQPERAPHLGGHRRPRLPAREEGPRAPGAPAAGNPRRHRGREARRRRERRHRPARQGQGEVRRHGAGARRRPPGSSASRRSGPSATACIRSCASRTGPPTDAPPRSGATTSC